MHGPPRHEFELTCVSVRGQCCGMFDHETRNSAVVGDVHTPACAT